MTAEERRIAEALRRACIDAAREGYEQAAAGGLCDEGAFEAAVSAMQMLDLEAAFASALAPDDGSSRETH